MEQNELQALQPRDKIRLVKSTSYGGRLFSKGAEFEVFKTPLGELYTTIGGRVYPLVNVIASDFEKVEKPETIKFNDKVEHPSHYTWLKEKCGIEVIDITRHMDFDLGNSIKYILRCNHKSEKGYTDREKAIEDLKKAIWYINDKIKTLENVQ